MAKVSVAKLKAVSLILAMLILAAGWDSYAYDNDEVVCGLPTPIITPAPVDNSSCFDPPSSDPITNNINQTWTTLMPSCPSPVVTPPPAPIVTTPVPVSAPVAMPAPLPSYNIQIPTIPTPGVSLPVVNHPSCIDPINVIGNMGPQMSNFNTYRASVMSLSDIPAPIMPTLPTTIEAGPSMKWPMDIPQTVHQSPIFSPPQSLTYNQFPEFNSSLFKMAEERIVNNFGIPLNWIGMEDTNIEDFKIAHKGVAYIENTLSNIDPEYLNCVESLELVFGDDINKHPNFQNNTNLRMITKSLEGWGQHGKVYLAVEHTAPGYSPNYIGHNLVSHEMGHVVYEKVEELGTQGEHEKWNNLDSGITNWGGSCKSTWPGVLKCDRNHDTVEAFSVWSQGGNVSNTAKMFFEELKQGPLKVDNFPASGMTGFDIRDISQDRHPSCFDVNDYIINSVPAAGIAALPQLPELPTLSIPEPPAYRPIKSYSWDKGYSKISIRQGEMLDQDWKIFSSHLADEGKFTCSGVTSVVYDDTKFNEMRLYLDINDPRQERFREGITVLGTLFGADINQSRHIRPEMNSEVNINRMSPGMNLEVDIPVETMLRDGMNPREVLNTVTTKDSPRLKEEVISTLTDLAIQDKITPSEMINLYSSVNQVNGPKASYDTMQDIARYTDHIGKTNEAYTAKVLLKLSDQLAISMLGNERCTEEMQGQKIELFVDTYYNLPDPSRNLSMEGLGCLANCKEVLQKNPFLHKDSPAIINKIDGITTNMGDIITNIYDRMSVGH